MAACDCLDVELAASGPHVPRHRILQQSSQARNVCVAVDASDATDRKTNPSIDIVVGVSVWSLSGLLSVREQTERGRNAATWIRRSRKHFRKTACAWDESRPQLERFSEVVRPKLRVSGN